MAERVSLLLFLAGLLVCIVTGFSILYALAFGLICFFTYGLTKKHTVKQMLSMIWSGISTAKTILIVFVLIGVLTSVWRSAGTIPYLIYHAVGLIQPDYFVLYTFLLCSGMSFLLGTSFGTAATMGVICMTIAQSLGINPMLSGGAILAGVYFGDRCSPMSSSALLVSTLTKTDIYRNLVLMFKTAAVPFALTCIFYVVAARGSIHAGSAASLELFTEHFRMSWPVALPAVVILLFSLLRINVKTAMAVSIGVGMLVCIFVQEIPLIKLLPSLWFGYSSSNAELAALLNGGGIVSMARVTLIILISTSYYGIFKNTELLSGVKQMIQQAAQRITPLGAVLATSVFMNTIACNQTLATMLTFQTCEEVMPDQQKLAITLENTVIVLAPLIPWSIAGGLPLTTIGAPTSSIFFAFYLYLIPICHVVYELFLSKWIRRPAAVPKNG